MNDSSFNPTAFMYFNEWTLDGQTNYGPLYDRRWGIDIATPGSFIVSAKSDQNTSSFNCGSSNNGYFVNNGTSMATAVAAGAAVKVIEYFANGYYPYGIKGPSITYLPFGIVVKALLLHAAQPLSQANGNQRQFYLGVSHGITLIFPFFANFLKLQTSPTCQYPMTMKAQGLLFWTRSSTLLMELSRTSLVALLLFLMFQTTILCTYTRLSAISATLVLIECVFVLILSPKSLKQRSYGQMSPAPSVVLWH
jgi:hypothetical protein